MDSGLQANENEIEEMYLVSGSPSFTIAISKLDSATLFAIFLVPENVTLRYLGSLSFKYFQMQKVIK